MTKLSDIHAGDRLIPDNGFPCMTAGDPRIVSADNRGELYVCCAAGRHYLAGQTDEHGDLIGLTHAPQPEPTTDREPRP